VDYLIVSVISGILFGILDGVVHANPLGQRLLAVYKPLAKASINPIGGILIDLMYGFVMSGTFLLLYDSLPGEIGLLKGLAFALLVWFFRVFMNTASHWVMFKIPIKTLLYSLVTGLGEMLVMGVLYGLSLFPKL
jgi:hypothetical protein